jgi:hypothetical protein
MDDAAPPRATENPVAAAPADAGEAAPAETVRPSPPTRDEVLSRRIRDLELRIEGTPLEIEVRRLYDEMEAAGLALRPPVFLSDEWGCPEGVPAIGIPFYLADPRLAALEEEKEGSVEGPEEVASILRHEAGHAFNYAHLLYQEEEWHELFGPYSRPYLEDFQPNPFSRQFVRHFPGWYGQKHPDEDFAETFAVWLTPGSDWQEKYRNWPALRKLQYVDRKAKELGRSVPRVVAREPFSPDQDLERTVGEHYRALDEKDAMAAALRDLFDGDLKEVFDPDPSGDDVAAAEVIRERRGRLVETLSFWTGARAQLVRALLECLADRAEALGLRASRAEVEEQASRLTVFATTLLMNYLYRGKFAEV